MNIQTSILNDACWDEFAGGFNFARLFGVPALPSVPHAPAVKSLSGMVTNYVVSHSPIMAVAHALRFW
jgi:hypothetical protein